MADFFQTGTITTLHRLTTNGRERLEADLERFNTVNPIGLVLPALYREFESPAMQIIVDQLRNISYLRRLCVVINGADEEQYKHARTFFDGFRTPVTALWLEDPRMTELLELFAKNDLSPGGPGKGRACWMGFGSLFSDPEIEVVALHDCDILNYTSDILARLVYPIAHPNLGLEFNKGYYARVSDTLHGRVTRLFFTPLVRAIQGMTPEIPYLRFLDDFRYALAGEFAMTADLARVIRIPSHWGLEVGVLAEVYRNVATLRVCQVDLADNYEHKHQELSAEDPEKGLRRMTRDIAMSLFRSIAQEGFVLTHDHFRSLQIYYIRFAQDTIRRYHADAVINGLKLDRHAEDTAVSVFVQSLKDAEEAYLKDPLGAPQIPNWNRVVSAIPDVYDRIRDITADMQVGGDGGVTEVKPRSSLPELAAV